MKTKRIRATGVVASKLFTVALALFLVFAFNACDNGGGGGGKSGVRGIGGDETLTGEITITNEDGTLTASYDGDEDVTYQWNKDGKPIQGETGSTYTPPAGEEGSYTVTVSAPGYESKTSDPYDTSLPDLSGNITISKDGAELTATYTGNEENVEYKWYKDGELIQGATGNTYTATEAGNYTVTVTAPGYNSKTSRPHVTVTAGDLKYFKPGTTEYYQTGDTGPGGGIIFYDSFESIGEGEYLTMTDNGEQVRYLEVIKISEQSRGFTWTSKEFLPSDLGGTADWISYNNPENWLSFSIEGTETAIGTGRKNTTLILAVDSNAPAAKRCVDYRSNGLDGWFLPSLDELSILLRFIRDDLVFDEYRMRSWSSSQVNEGRRSNVYTVSWGYENDWIEGGVTKSMASYFVRPIRAF